jgi:hypothetical protein
MSKLMRRSPLVPSPLGMPSPASTFTNLTKQIVDTRAAPARTGGAGVLRVDDGVERHVQQPAVERAQVEGVPRERLDQRDLRRVQQVVARALEVLGCARSASRPRRIWRDTRGHAAAGRPSPGCWKPYGVTAMVHARRHAPTCCAKLHRARWQFLPSKQREGSVEVTSCGTAHALVF